MKKPSALCLAAIRRLSLNRRGGLMKAHPDFLAKDIIVKKSGRRNPPWHEMGPILPVSNFFQTLSTTAETYFSLRYSVIPLRGDLDTARPKAAAVPWKVYQSRRATLSDLHNWFIEQQFPALGIVPGVSLASWCSTLIRPNYSSILRCVIPILPKLAPYKPIVAGIPIFARQMSLCPAARVLASIFCPKAVMWSRRPRPLAKPPIE